MASAIRKDGSGRFAGVWLVKRRSRMMRWGSTNIWLMRLATELGMRPLVAHCHLGLGKLFRRTGQREQAQEHLTTATTMYREIGMTYWLEQADTERQYVA